MVAAGFANILNNKYYFHRLRTNNNRPVPEARLPPMMLGRVVYAGGLFLYGCKSYPLFSRVIPCSTLPYAFIHSLSTS